MKSPRIQRGKIVLYRVFDVAEEIDLAAVERILSQAQGESRVRLDRTIRQAVIVRNAPVRARLGSATFEAASFGKLTAEAYATVLDYGVFSISFHLPIARGTAWEELVKLADVLNRTDEIDHVARGLSRDLAQQLSSALKRPTEWNVFEDYVIYQLEEVEGVRKGEELVERADVPALLLAETKDKLGPKSRNGILEYQYQYAEDDLVVIDWNSAVVFEPSGSLEIADVLEFALSHLLEVRYYDDLLDRRLTELYDTAEVKRASPWYGRFAGLAKEANTRYLEISEIMERVDNSIKVVGDYYLAVIFRAAIRRFRVLDWQASISRKMQSLAKVSELLRGEINTSRSHLLEMIVILLILFEVLQSFFRARH
jgi:hypothetical protein